MATLASKHKQMPLQQRFALLRQKRVGIFVVKQNKAADRACWSFSFIFNTKYLLVEILTLQIFSMQSGGTETI